MTWRKAREKEKERKTERVIHPQEGEKERARLDVRSAGNKDNSMQ